MRFDNASSFTFLFSDIYQQIEMLLVLKLLYN